MTTSTLGSNANNSLPLAMQFQPTGPAADFAALRLAMFDDGANSQGGAAASQVRLQWPTQSVPMGWDQNGMLIIPRRGALKVLPGDWVAIDNRGWPILLSADTIANGLWTHNP